MSGVTAGGEWTRMPGILIVDDEEDMQLLVQAVILEANEGLEIVGNAGTGEEAVERWRELHPDIILLDQRMPGMSGIEAAEQILAEQPDQRIILFSSYLDDETNRRAKQVGVLACIDKTDVGSVPEAVWKYTGH
jgi:two-component system, chemotaxis family, chemotaxis protein CheY